MNIVIDWGLVIGASVVLAWAVNSGLPLLGRLLGQSWSLSTNVKKAVAFGFSVVLTGFWRTPIELPDPAADPFLFAGALLAQAEVVFKAAQEVYDHLWKAITSKVAGLFK